MKLWIIKPLDEKEGKGWEPWNPCYDKCFGVIARAETERVARILAATCKGDEGADVWLDPAYTSCTQLETEGQEEVIMMDFHSA